MFKWLKKFLPKKSTNAEMAYTHALIALGYWQKALKENPDEEGACIIITGTNHSITMR